MQRLLEERFQELAGIKPFSEVTIKDEQSKSYSVEEFLDKIKKLKVIQNG